MLCTFWVSLNTEDPTGEGKRRLLLHPVDSLFFCCMSLEELDNIRLFPLVRRWGEEFFDHVQPQRQYLVIAWEFFNGTGYIFYFYHSLMENPDYWQVPNPRTGVNSWHFLISVHVKDQYKFSSDQINCHSEYTFRRQWSRGCGRVPLPIKEIDSSLKYFDLKPKHICKHFKYKCIIFLHKK